MSQRRVLVVDDEATICDAVAARLRAEGFDVVTASDGPAAVAECEASSPDLLVLDVMLPGFDGLEVCRRVQASRLVPVLMLTARADETDMLIGLGVGADDYLSKPFSMRVLVARVHALLRRAERAHDTVATERDGLSFGDIEVDVVERRVRRGADEIHLTRTEFDLLAYFASRPRAAITRESLLAEVWGWGDAAGSRTVDSHVKALRRKLGGDLIRTVHGVGYALDVAR
ncbi:response regulator transcription factor [Rhodococcus opacus]|nr:response regulator transcription factor [Rhodococcus opacus]RZL76103.1 MAG: response regulator transcription factor [Rhodococcus sp. (in: high G+C Gram-positive bacteria)]